MDLDEALRHMDLPRDISDFVAHFLDDVFRLWSENPTRFGSSLSDGTHGWPTIGGLTNLIPSPLGGSCQQVLIVICRSRTEFHNHVRLAQEHFYDCLAMTKTVIFLSSYWDGEYFARERQPTFERLASDQGIDFNLLLKTGRNVGFSRLTLA
jgi:hypothetical protein